MRHELKVAPEFFCRFKDGSKTFEVRKNTNIFQQGDVVVLWEFNPRPINATDNAPQGLTDSTPLEFKIGFIEILDNFAILSLLPIAPIKKAKK